MNRIGTRMSYALRKPRRSSRLESNRNTQRQPAGDTPEFEAPRTGVCFPDAAPDSDSMHCPAPSESKEDCRRDRAARLLATRIEFVPHDSFSEPGTAESLLATAIPHCVCDVEVPEGLPAYLASLYEIPLLSHEAEGRLFAKFNYLKFEASRLCATVNPARPRETTLNRIEALLREATAVRNQIVRANLRLIVAIAKKFVTKTTVLEDLVSEGHLPLIRAVELFDFSRGYHFSTYGTWAVRNHFVRILTDQKKLRARYSTGESFVLATASETRGAVQESERKLSRQRTLVAHYLDHLRPREQEILAARFGLADHGHPQTLSEIGRHLGISKERVRQVTIRALARLREFASREPVAV